MTYEEHRNKLWKERDEIISAIREAQQHDPHEPVMRNLPNEGTWGSYLAGLLERLNIIDNRLNN